MLRLQLVARAQRRLLLRTHSDGQLGILRALAAPHQDGGTAGEGQEAVHGLTTGDGVRSALEEGVLDLLRARESTSHAV